MRAADPVHNVELRRNAQGHDSVVFAFPYRAEIVDSVRAIPGRRFDWEAKEWWAPRADAVAPFVKGVLERHPSLSVAPDVQEWLSRAVTGWIGRVTAGRLQGEGRFVLETIAGSRVALHLRKGRGHIAITSPLFEYVREPSSLPMRRYYAAAYTECLRLCDVDAQVEVDEAATGCRLRFAVRGAPAAADADRAGV